LLVYFDASTPVLDYWHSWTNYSQMPTAGSGKDRDKEITLWKTLNQ